MHIEARNELKRVTQISEHCTGVTVAGEEAGEMRGYWRLEFWGNKRCCILISLTWDPFYTM